MEVKFYLRRLMFARKIEFFLNSLGLGHEILVQRRPCLIRDLDKYDVPRLIHI